MRTRWSALTAMITVMPSVGMASDLSELLKASDCPERGAVISNDLFLDRVLDKSGLKLSSQTASLLSSGALGVTARSKVAKCAPELATGQTPAACKESDKALYEAYSAAAILLDRLTWNSDDIVVEFGPDRPTSRDDTAVAVLNRQMGWMRIVCRRAFPPGDSPPPLPPAAKGWTFAAGKTEADASRTLDKREYATVGLDTDQVADTSVFSADVFLGFGRWDTLAPRSVFLSYQRKTPSSNLNDLAFGVSAAKPFSGLGGTNYVTGLLAWETDDKFRSSAWRAQAGWSPQFAFCEESTEPLAFYFNCDIAAVVDYSDVLRAGRKEKLLTRESFTRGGVDLKLEAWWARGEKLGFLTFATTYSMREDLTDADASADLFTASVGIKTGDKSQFKFSLDYSNGEDLTSLEEINTIKLSLGYRQ